MASQIFFKSKCYINAIFSYSFDSLGEYTHYKLKTILFKKYIRFHLGYFDAEANTPALVIAKLNNECKNVNDLVFSFYAVAIQTLIIFVVSISIGFTYNWLGCLLGIVSFPIMVYSNYIMKGLIVKATQKNDMYRMSSTEIVSESVNNTKTVFSYCLEDKILLIFFNHLNKATAGIIFTLLWESALNGFSITFIFLVNGINIYIGSICVSNGLFDAKSFYISFATVALGLFFSNNSFRFAANFGKSTVALNTIMKVLNDESKLDPLEENVEMNISEFKGRIEFKNVSFAYPTRPKLKVLKDISFTIYPGQKAAFIGHSGSGKSTIIQLIERFYDPDEGTILIDGVDINRYSIKELRQNISLVSQEPALFKLSVKDNIKYGKFNSTEEELEEVAKQYNILHLLNQNDLPVSGGEKQRIAIARAMIRKPRILLLDEATSALDKKNENEIQGMLDNVMKDKTIVSIAHR